MIVTRSILNWSLDTKTKLLTTALYRNRSAPAEHVSLSRED